MTANNTRLSELAEQAGAQLLALHTRLVTAESCTGGGVAFAITAIAGSSGWFDRGFVVYSNQAKVDMLGVQETTLERYGAVSEKVAREMATGALQHSGADISLAVTGIAGPSGGSPDKPVGTVCFAWQHKDGRCVSRRYQLQGDRESIREQSVILALEGVLALQEDTAAKG